MRDMTTTYFDHAGVANAGIARRGILLFSFVLFAAAGAAAVAWGAIDPSPTLARDPELALLLRGMAAIKTLVVAAALCAVGWRVRQPIGRRDVLGYAIATMAMSAATAAIWQLSWLIPAAVLFHAGLVGFLVVAWRDDHVRLPAGRTLPTRA